MVLNVVLPLRDGRMEGTKDLVAQKDGQGVPAKFQLWFHRKSNVCITVLHNTIYYTYNFYIYMYTLWNSQVVFPYWSLFYCRPPQWREGSRSHQARRNKRDLGQGSLAESQDFIWHLKGLEINIGSGASICGGLLRITTHWSPNKRG